MSAITGTLSNEKRISAFIRSHSIIAYFVLAFVGTWIVISGTQNLSRTKARITA